MQFVLMLKFTAYVEIQKKCRRKTELKQKEEKGGNSVLMNEGSSQNGLPREGGLN